MDFLGWHIRKLLITVHNILLDCLMKHVHLGRSKLPCADASLEKHVKLCKGAATRLRQTKEGVNNAQKANAALFSLSVTQNIYFGPATPATYPEESCIVAPVPGCGVEHVGSQNTVDDANNVAINRLARLTNELISTKVSDEDRVLRLRQCLGLTIDCGQEQLS